ncbi:MAG: hypothetical protein K9M10_00660 [Candidatus Pacebacteria bacterium]|nr:hypothetical protein [Candidatus Paceibacterota bacterium]MCF7856974.1 hypothetical protein [Candidatus Paceibacterota bacterium]
MCIREIIITGAVAVIFTPIAMSIFGIAGAQVMQSSGYRIQSDSINFGGGLSTSTNYALEATAGEVASGDGASASFNIRAGYQQMVNSFISISAASSVTMTPSIPGVSGGIANGSTSVTIITDSAAGYQLTIAASQSPALTNLGNSIADYVPSGNPDFSFITGASDSHFGYSPSGVDIVDRFKDNGAVCGGGGGEVALACWDGLSTDDVPIARSSSANTPNGATTTVYFRVGVGGSVVQTGGTYTATTTLTAVSL